MSESAFSPFLYYWDDRDGAQWQGWWVAPEVGSEQFCAFSIGDATSPDLCTRWRGGDAFIDMAVCSLAEDDGPLIMGLRAQGNGIEGVYVLCECTHDHGGRPVFRRSRDLEAAEVAKIDEMRHGSDVITYTRDLTLDALADVLPAAAAAASRVGGDGGVEPVVGVTVGMPHEQSVLQWVHGGDISIVQGVPIGDATGGAGAAADGTVQPRLRVRVECASDLDALVAKGPEEILSVPELADEDSPLPVGWMVAARSTVIAACSVKDHLELAASRLETELAADVAELPEVQAMAQRIRRLVGLLDGPFTVCIWPAHAALV